MTSRYPVVGFFKNQIEKTIRNPARVPIIIADRVNRIFRRAFIGPVRRLSRAAILSVERLTLQFDRWQTAFVPSVEVAAPLESDVPSCEVGVPLEDDVANESEQDFGNDARSIFEAGIRALDDVRIAKAVRLLMRAATLDCSTSDFGSLWIKREACKNLGVALHNGLRRLDEAVCWWRESERICHL